MGNWSNYLIAGVGLSIVTVVLSWRVPNEKLSEHRFVCLLVINTMPVLWPLWLSCFIYIGFKEGFLYFPRK